MLSCGHTWIFTYMCAALKKCLETRESAIIHLLPLEKQSKQRRNRGLFKIPKFFEDKELRPVLGVKSAFKCVTHNLDGQLDYVLMRHDIQSNKYLAGTFKNFGILKNPRILRCFDCFSRGSKCTMALSRVSKHFFRAAHI